MARNFAKFITLAVFFFLVFAAFATQRTKAFDSSSTNFKIRAGDIEGISGGGTSTNFKGRSAGGQSASGLSISTNYKDYSGILYWLYPAGGNQAPEVDNVQLNSQSNINLNEGTTESVSATADVYDAQGCSTITGVVAKIYRSGVSGAKDCTPDNNNCYSVASCTETSCSGTDAVYTCTINMQFHADPTDGSAEYWRAWIEADDGELTGSNYSPADAPDVITLQALSVTPPIGYGELDPGQNTGSTNQETTVTNTGNSAIDIRLFGADMTWSGNIIDTANQEYSLSGFTYGAGNDLKEGPSYDDVNADLPKPTQSPSNSSDIFYWGLGVPSLMPAGPYQGSNTFEAINAL